MHGAMRSMSISTGHATAGASGTSKELSNSMGYSTIIFTFLSLRGGQGTPKQSRAATSRLLRLARNDNWRSPLRALDQLQQPVRRNRGLGDPHPERRQGVLDRGAKPGGRRN